ncbi:unnamed protein product, partial [Allacma fusca]
LAQWLSDTDAISLGISQFRQSVNKHLNMPPARWLTRFTLDIQDCIESVATSAPSNYAVEHPIAYEDYLTRKLVSSTIASGTSFGKFFEDILSVCKGGKLKVSRYVEDSINVIKGRCNRFEAELISQKLCILMVYYTSVYRMGNICRRYCRFSVYKHLLF